MEVIMTYKPSFFAMGFAIVAQWASICNYRASHM
jgi:hypothetical protein